MEDTRLIDIVKQCRGLAVLEERNLEFHQIELIIYRKEMSQWVAKFTEQLGPALKPEGVKPTEEHLKITKSFGGINQYQTLFKKDLGDKTVLVMLWPWGDEEHVTLHLILQ